MATASAAPWFAVQHFIDADEFATSLQGSGVEYVPLQAGPYEARLTIASLGPMLLQRAEDRAHVTRGRVDTQVAGMLFAMKDEGDVLLNGWRVGAAEALVLSPGGELHSLCPGDVDWASLTFSPASAQDLFDLAGIRWPDSRGESVLRIPQAAVRPVRDAVAEATTMIHRLPPGVDAPAWTSALADGLQETVFAAFASAGEIGIPRATREPIRLVTAAEDLLRANPARPIYTEDLCVALGVRPRTLHTAFVAVCGMSPQAYLRRRRLMQVHATLKRGGLNARLVKSVALTHGFWHLGHFARSYRDQFGQTPSQTMANAQTGRFRRTSDDTEPEL